MAREFHWPKGFLWGAAVAAHQVEGGNVNNWSDWELQTAKTRAKKARGHFKHLSIWPDIEKLATDADNYVSGLATDHYHRYKEDFDLAEQMHMNAFRFSIEWSRIEPEEGAWNIEAIEHYREYIHDLRRRGIEPVLTLYHWTVPRWFAAKGGFEHARNIKHFLRFAEKVLREYKNDLKYICTINEPDTVAMLGYGMCDEHPPGGGTPLQLIYVYKNLLSAHRQTYSLAKKISKQFKVGFVKSYASVGTLDNRLLSKSAVWLDNLIRDEIVFWYVGKKTDYYGVNFYFYDGYHGWHRHHPIKRFSDLGWTMAPDRLEDVLLRIGKRKKPIIITENGVADMRDQYRTEWLDETMLAMQHALQAGVKLKGYLHWSLTDNFEWAYGRWPAFGLVKIDYEHNRRRMLRKSGEHYGELIKKARLQERN